MDILRTIEKYAAIYPKRTAVCNGKDFITYGQLIRYSSILKKYIEEKSDNNSPIVIYGHKNPMTIAAMLACSRAKRAYVPIDMSVPANRTEMIINQVDSNIVFATEDISDINISETKDIVTIEKMYETIYMSSEDDIETECDGAEGDDVFYIIFTSGSTGTPKGVEITADCLNNFLEWSVNLGSSRQEKEGKVFLNQAPFSFDLSVMDLYTCLSCAGTLWCLDKNTQSDYGLLMESLRKSQSSVWVSTPSFADICLTEKKFNENLMPKIETFLFCGETLTNVTAKKLKSRFPNAKIINTYGPTESTVAVTDVEITEDLIESCSPLPVGIPKSGTSIEIWSKNNDILDKEKGEIIILGDTVSSGYYKSQELTRKAFFKCERKGEIFRGYHTGDEGYIKDGMLYYCGRIDLQVKLHGYRIEIEDIESNLLKIDEIDQAVVVANMRDNKVRSLNAYIVYKKDAERQMDTRALSLKIKEKLKQYVPDYMIPKKFIFLDEIPVTSNGKADRRSLEARG